MSDTSDLGVLYTEHSSLTARTPISSLWSYDTRSRGRHRPPVALNADGNHEYWLDRWDPLLNTILPGTAVSLVVNLGDSWAAGRSPATSAFLPRVCVVGPFTQSRILRVGPHVKAIGAVLPPTVTGMVFGVPASELVDHIVPLDDLWNRDDVERLFAAASCGETARGLPALKDDVMMRMGQRSSDPVGPSASRLLQRHAGGIPIDRLATQYGLSRQQFTRRFSASAGLPPKVFARLTRFQALVHALLSTDVSRWALLSSELGFYDQAHMINEFRAFTGSSPTVFFQPHGSEIDPVNVQLRGRPSEWVRRPEHP